jgi:hypothetical protein
LIPSGWAAIFFPDFPGAISDFSFFRLRHSAGSLFQFVSQRQYAADRFVVADPQRELAVLIGLGEKMADDLLLIHGALPSKIRRLSREIVQGRWSLAENLLGRLRRSGTQADNEPLSAPTGRSDCLILSRPDAACTSYRIDHRLRNGGTIGLGHHVPSILNEVQDGMPQRPV